MAGSSNDATVVEVRAHDEPGLLWRIGRALGECGLNVQAARVETLGAEAVDVFYVTDATGGLVTDPDLRKRTVKMVLAALTTALSQPTGTRRAEETPLGARAGSLKECLRRSPIG
jgi:UTP:GlnB (protein PII) uridylyltransferase